MDKEVQYSGFNGNGKCTPLINPPTINNKKEEKYIYDCSCCECVGYMTVVITVLLTLVFGILFMVLTAVGGENTSSREKNCHCKLFTRELGYGLGISLLLEVGMLFAVLALAVGAALCKQKAAACEKLVEYYSFVAGIFVAINYISFLGMTLAVIVFVATGGVCCSVTSIVVASLSAVMSAFKLVLIFIILCYLYFKNSD